MCENGEKKHHFNSPFTTRNIYRNARISQYSGRISASFKLGLLQDQQCIVEIC